MGMQSPRARSLQGKIAHLQDTDQGILSKLPEGNVGQLGCQL